MSDKPNTVTIKTIKHVAVPMTPENEAMHELLSYCNRIIGYLNRLADDMERMSKDKADRCREFAEQVDILRVVATRALVQRQADEFATKESLRVAAELIVRAHDDPNVTIDESRRLCGEAANIARPIVAHVRKIENGSA